MVDPHHLVVGVQPVPAGSLIGVHRGPGRNVLANERERIGFLGDHDGQRPAATLARDDDRLPLAGLLFRQPPIFPLGYLIRRIGVTAHIGGNRRSRPRPKRMPSL